LCSQTCCINKARLRIYSNDAEILVKGLLVIFLNLNAVLAVRRAFPVP